MKLPVTVAGALMPDAHYGYGLPIGGVLATDNAVIPYAVGVDIGCRMALSVFDLPAKYLTQRVQELRKVLLDNTRFGSGRGGSGASAWATTCSTATNFRRCRS
jgi:tRNA-splicing ligase RtcB